MDHPWRGSFAEARNVSLDLARGEWALYIDADERVVGADRAGIERLLTNADEVAFRVLFQPMADFTPYREYRLWRNDPRIRFSGMIHESMLREICDVARSDGRPIGLCDLLLVHVGYEADQGCKHARNLPLLRAELVRDPDNLFKRHHLWRVLTGLGHDEEAAAVLADALALARRRPADHNGALVFEASIGHEHAHGGDVARLLAEADVAYPGYKQLWWLRAAVHMSDRCFDAALGPLDQLVATDPVARPDALWAYDQRIFGEFALDARGVCLYRLSRYGEAAQAFTRALDLAPGNHVYRAKQQMALRRAGASEVPSEFTLPQQKEEIR